MVSLTEDIDDICECCKQPIFKNEADRPPVTFDRITLNPALRSCLIDGTPMHVTGKEFEILYLLFKRKGTVVSKESVFACIYGFDSDTDCKVIDVFLCKLRKKFRERAGIEDVVTTHWGRGYSVGVSPRS